MQIKLKYDMKSILVIKVGVETTNKIYTFVNVLKSNNEILPLEKSPNLQKKFHLWFQHEYTLQEYWIVSPCILLFKTYTTNPVIQQVSVQILVDFTKDNVIEIKGLQNWGYLNCMCSSYRVFATGIDAKEFEKSNIIFYKLKNEKRNLMY